MVSLILGLSDGILFDLVIAAECQVYSQNFTKIFVSAVVKNVPIFVCRWLELVY